MRPFSILSIALIIPICIGIYSQNSDTTTAELGNYCNARFDFCLRYPSELLSQRFVSDNGDGIRLASADGKIQATAYGALPMEGWTLTDTHQSIMENLTSESKKVVVLTNEIGKTTYEATIQTDNELRCYKTVIQPSGDYVTLTITVPNGMEELLHSLKNDLKLEPHS